jgi:hypothetical protein
LGRYCRQSSKLLCQGWWKVAKGLTIVHHRGRRLPVGPMRRPMVLRAVQDTSIAFVPLSSNPGPLGCVRRGFSPEEKVSIHIHKIKSSKKYSHTFFKEANAGVSSRGALPVQLNDLILSRGKRNRC